MLFKFWIMKKYKDILITISNVLFENILNTIRLYIVEAISIYEFQSKDYNFFYKWSEIKYSKDKFE
jgi:hypothetical protein